MTPPGPGMLGSSPAAPRSPDAHMAARPPDPSDRARCEPLGLQTQRQRFEKQRQHERTTPTIYPWRCNLTALSHAHNLYFVAYGHCIYVYIPQFPTQTVPEQPAVIVASQPSIPGQPGFLSHREPHAINSLIVQHLGNDEVVAAVRDDGDVEIVLVRHIVQAIERRAKPKPGNLLTLEASEVRSIFQSNVGSSAWGLAIHTEARILATSSNLHEVRIFKFALTDDNDVDSHLDEVDEDSDTGNDSTENRRRDITQRIINGDANIPHIAFCNTGDDPDARWLLTTDINGYCRVLDLHAKSESDVTANEFRMGPGRQSDRPVFDRFNAGWGVMFLDRRSFIWHADWFDACGISINDELKDIQSGHNNEDEAVNISQSVDSVGSTSQAFYYHSSPSTDDGDFDSMHGSPRSFEFPPQPRLIDPAPVDASLPDDNARLPPRHALPDGRIYTRIDLADSISRQDGENAGVIDEVAGNLVERAIDNDNGQHDDDEEDDSEEDDDYMNDLINELEQSSLDSDDDSDDDDNEDDASMDSRQMKDQPLSSGNPGYAPTTLCGGLPSPILHTSVKNVYLLQPSNPERPGIPTTAPVVTLQDPLRQSVLVHWAYLNDFNRLNMHAYIPELGVVVIGSQKGRAAVISLTKAVRPNNRKAKPGPTCYTMRVDAVIPYDTQEKGNQRPPFPLHGIAVGPIQGTERLPAHRKRWRLMMMYQDHSILSYELTRRSVEHDPTTELYTIVV